MVSLEKRLAEFKNEVAEEVTKITKEGIEDGAQLVQDLCVRFTGGTDLDKIKEADRDDFISELWIEAEKRLEAFRERVNEEIGFDYEAHSDWEDGPNPGSEAVGNLLYDFGVNDLDRLKASDREDFLGSLPDAMADAEAEAEKASMPRDSRDDRLQYECFVELSAKATEPEEKIRYLAQAWIELNGGNLSKYDRAQILARARRVIETQLQPAKTVTR